MLYIRAAAAALVKAVERERTYLPMNVEDKTRFVFNDVFQGYFPNNFSCRFMIIT